MKFTHTIMIFILSSLIFVSCYSGFQHCMTQQKNIIETKKKINRIKFISESFINTCQGSGFENLNQWQKTCRALWNLQYIGWSNANEFMLLPDNATKELIYGTWKSENGNGEIYALKEN